MRFEYSLLQLNAEWSVSQYKKCFLNIQGCGFLNETVEETL